MVMNAKRLLVFADIILIGLVLWLGTVMVMEWMAPARGGPAARSEKEGKQVGHLSDRDVMKTMRNYSYIITHDVFGTVKKTQQASTQTKAVQVTRLPLRLRGTIVGTDHINYAIIQEGNVNKDELFGINDVVQRARIVKIASDYIILDVNGKKEVLNISYDTKPARAPISRFRRPAVVPRSPAQMPEAVSEGRTTSRAPAILPRSPGLQ